MTGKDELRSNFGESWETDTGTEQANAKLELPGAADMMIESTTVKQSSMRTIQK